MTRTRRIPTVAVPLLVTLLASAIGAALLWSVRDELPSQIASHWGVQGRADDFSSFTEIMTLGLLLPVGTVAPIALLGLAIRHGASLAGVSAGTGVFMAALSFGSAYAQRGVADGEFVRLTNSMFLWPTALGIAVGVLVGLALRSKPRPGPDSPVPADAARADVSASAQIAWHGGLRRGRAGEIVFAVAVLAVAVIGIVLWITSGIWFVALIALLLLVLLHFFWAEVTIDHRGLSVSAMGKTLRRVPLERLQVGRVTQVRCLGEYGGWGFRGGFDGSWGYVTSDGEALRVERNGEPDLVLTIDDAHAAAATLNTLLDRRQS